MRKQRTDRAPRQLFASTAHQLAGQVLVLRLARDRIQQGMTIAQAHEAIDSLVADIQGRLDRNSLHFVEAAGHA